MSYDSVSFFEPRIRLQEDGDPLGSFYLVSALLVFDHFQRKIKIIILNQKDDSASVRYSKNLLEEILDALRGPVRIPHSTVVDQAADFRPNMSQSEFEKIVELSRKHIYAGDVFQIVPSQALSGETYADSFQIYRALRMLNRRRTCST